MNRLSDQAFAAMSRPVRMSAAIRSAARAVLVKGRRWADAAKEHGVTEGGISKAIKRLRAAHQRCPACGQAHSQAIPKGIHETATGGRG